MRRIKTLNQETTKAQAAQDLAILVARTLDLKKADNIDILDLSRISILADFFVFAAGFAHIQIQALADEVLKKAREAGFRSRAVEGYQDSGWILIDFGDVVVHLMTQESRDYYRLERLWGDAPRVEWNPNSDDEMEKE